MGTCITRPLPALGTLGVPCGVWEVPGAGITGSGERKPRQAALDEEPFNFEKNEVQNRGQFSFLPVGEDPCGGGAGLVRGPPLPGRAAGRPGVPASAAGAGPAGGGAGGAAGRAGPGGSAAGRPGTPRLAALRWRVFWAGWRFLANKYQSVRGGGGRQGCGGCGARGRGRRRRTVPAGAALGAAGGLPS